MKTDRRKSAIDADKKLKQYKKVKNLKTTPVKCKAAGKPKPKAITTDPVKAKRRVVSKPLTQEQTTPAQASDLYAQPDFPKRSTALTYDARLCKAHIPKKVRTDVWNTFIGPHIPIHKCLCCLKTTICMTDFQVGHVLSENDGGNLSIDNLRPICASCNISMGTTNMKDYVVKYGYLI